MIDPGISGRTVLLTGANCGIGRAVALRLAREGARLLLTYLRLDPAEHEGDPAFPAEYGVERARAGEEVAAEARRLGGEAAAVEADLRDEAVIPRLFDRAETDLGPVEILIHCASGWLADTFVPDRPDRFGRALTRVAAATFDRQLSVDARAGGTLIAEFARRHIRRNANWGRILTFTSGSTEGFPQEVSYGAAKAALESYTKSAALELGIYGVTANALFPPATDTGWITPDVRRAVESNSPSGQVAQPEQVAEVALFLVSEQARLVTGNVVRMA